MNEIKDDSWVDDLVVGDEVICLKRFDLYGRGDQGDYTVPGLVVELRKKGSNLLEHYFETYSLTCVGSTETDIVSLSELKAYFGLYKKAVALRADGVNKDFEAQAEFIKPSENKSSEATTEGLDFDYFKLVEELDRRCLEISRAKNADYTAGSGDPFANFTGVATASHQAVTTEQGFLTRIYDKYARISSYVKNGQLLVKDESVQDTLMDLINYCKLFYGYLEREKIKENKNAK